jgi:hypothetical protein
MWRGISARIDSDQPSLNKKRVRFLLLFLLAVLTAGSASSQIGAFQTDCQLGGAGGHKSYQFVATCAGRAASPNKQFAIVQRAYEDRQPAIELQDRRGRKITEIKQLTDDMPFAVFWSPDSRWFLVNHHVGSFMDRPEVYEVAEGKVVSHDRFRHIGQRLAQRLFPCLPQTSTDWASGSAVGWSKDGSRIAWVFITRTDMCNEMWGGKSVPDERSWRPVWMISEIPSGRIVPGSVHVDRSDGPLELPRDHRYDEFR